jgi:SAM-dependent methyltransferase
MSLFQKLKEFNRKQQFRPGPLALIFNANYFIKKGIYEGVKRHSKKLTGVMLDFGCGSKPYRDLFQVKQYVGLDIINEAHDHTGEDIDVLYDGKKIPFPDAHFDSIFSSEVFEHVFNLDEVLAELSRVLKKDGLLLITLPFVWIEHEKPNDFARYTTFAVKEILKKHGFEITVHERSSSYIEVIAQLRSAYLYKSLIPRNKVLKAILVPLLIFPSNLIGKICSAISPRNDDLYLNHIVVARKV